MSHPPNHSPDRLHGLDALRGIALLLGVMLHASMSFLPGARYFWITSDARPSAVLSPVFFVPHSFRMILFFLLAGFFAHMSLHRLGWRGFVKDRWKRIAIPLLAGWPIVFTAIVAVLVWAAMLANGGALPKQSPPGPAFTPSDFPLTHLWFLYELLLCYAAALLTRTAVAAIDRGGRLRAAVDGGMRRLVGWTAPALLAMPLCASLYLQQQWYAWFGIPTPDQALYPNLPALVAFGTAFAFGWLLHRQTALLQAIERCWWFHGVLAVVATVAAMALIGLLPGSAPAPKDAHTLAYAALYSLAGWSWTFAAIGAALRFFNGYSPVRRYLADASYWIYLTHLPLVMALQVAIARLDWPTAVKFPLVLAAVLAIGLASYQLLVRYSFIGAVLNGRRRARNAVAPRVGQALPALDDSH